MISPLQSRDAVLDSLRREIVGPDPMGDEITFQPNKPYPDKPVCQQRTAEQIEQNEPAEEILRGERPFDRYGCGVLYPKQILAEELADTENAAVEPGYDDEGGLSEEDDFGKLSSGTGREDEEPLLLESANRFQPSSLGLSFVVDVVPGQLIRVEVAGGRYVEKLASVLSFTQPNDGTVATWNQSWWFRLPVRLQATFPSASLIGKDRGYIDAAEVVGDTGPLSLGVRMYTRPVAGLSESQRLVTVVLTNQTSSASAGKAELCLFQAGFIVRVLNAHSEDPEYAIQPYRRVEPADADNEEQVLALLYRHAETFAVGHGCAANWETTPANEVAWVATDTLPVYEAPTVVADLRDESGTSLAVSMNDLALLELGGPTHESLLKLVETYAKWIGDRRREAEELTEEHRGAAVRNLEECELCLARMEDGLRFLAEEPDVLTAFRLANEAMFLQGKRSSLNRKLIRDENNRITFGPHPPGLDLAKLSPKDRRNWRPFQIAFLLMSLRSSVSPTHEDRLTTDLIWFPTGGGKTEAYLGLAAFSTFYRRLKTPNDHGTQVLMRYTLRLLTQQQLQRASSLICAMEQIRLRLSKALGERPFTIGIWAGGEVTPNDRDTAQQILRDLIRKGRSFEGNLLILTKCPWCGAEMKIEQVAKERFTVYGASQTGGTIVYSCPDRECAFAGSTYGKPNLPVEFIDEDIYRRPPTLVIGTVDKFATLHLRPDARSLFGLTMGEDGTPVRTRSAPGLIIQDELHLISGPLGSMVGLYETLIAALCTDAKQPHGPKIVCSTATIRRYREQATRLFAAKHVQLFPPPALHAGDSFFAQYAREADGSLARGRMYVGVHPTGYTSGQTARVRTLSTLLQAPCDLVSLLPEDSACRAEEGCPFRPGAKSCDERVTNGQCRLVQDPWWTLLVFFNSLRDLGNAITLFQSDIPDFRQTILRRRASAPAMIRKAYRPRELTSRLRNDEIPQQLKALEVKRTDGEHEAVGVCLASSIIEVGIDVDRLSLMCVVAQPKTTATYIQVTGRVGRSWQQQDGTWRGAPGLVVALYAADRPRDRSHFERFRSYHERLYAQVEPTSVTPFSPPVLERALHGVYSAYVRLTGTEAVVTSPDPFPADGIKTFFELLLERITRTAVKGVNSDEEREAARQIGNKKLRRWSPAPPRNWLTTDGSSDALLTYPSGNPLKASAPTDTPWETPVTMRNVDATCELALSQAYVDEGEDIV